MNTSKKIRIGSRVGFDYGSEYAGPSSWKVLARDHMFLGQRDQRYTVSNGTSKDLIPSY